MTNVVAYRFDRAIALERRGDCRVSRVLDEGWNFGNFFNGGYLHSLTANTARELTGQHPDPVAISSTFVAPPQSGEVDIDVTVLSAGRTVTSTLVTMTQNGKPVVVSMVTLGSLPDDPTPPGVLPRRRCYTQCPTYRRPKSAGKCRAKDG